MQIHDSSGRESINKIKPETRKEALSNEIGRLSQDRQYILNHVHIGRTLQYT